MASTYEAIQSTTLGSAASSVTLSSIPGTKTDLVLVMSGYTSLNDRAIRVQLNGDTGSNYSHTNVLGYSGGTLSQRNSSATFWNIANNWMNSQQCTTVAHFMSYANTNVYKTILSAEATGTSVVTKVVGLWRSTAAITSITLFPLTGDFAAGCTFSLFGIKAA